MATAKTGFGGYKSELKAEKIKVSLLLFVRLKKRGREGGKVNVRGEQSRK